MQGHRVVSKEEWLAVRIEYLKEEKRLTRLRDQLSQSRRELPWVRVDKEYLFHGPRGSEALSDLFDGRSQLIVYHFMFGPDWEEGCKSCSFWADNFDGTEIHLKHRDISFVVVSRAELEVLEGYKSRMGWRFKWVSSYGSDFNSDYQASFSEEEVEKDEGYYNFRVGEIPGDEAAGVSVFYKNDQGEIFHTYSCYSRGLDMLNGAYQYMDLAPKGRDEGELPYTMAWLHRHDDYPD